MRDFQLLEIFIVILYGIMEYKQRHLLSKTEEELMIQYRDGFKANEETITVRKNETNVLKSSAIRVCDKGVKSEHAPYNPGYFEKWRYNPSSFAFSIKSDGTSVVMGISNDSPNTPVWYRLYNFLTVVGGPHAYVMFDMTQQTNLFQYDYSNKQEI